MANAGPVPLGPGCFKIKPGPVSSRRVVASQARPRGPRSGLGSGEPRKRTPPRGRGSRHMPSSSHSPARLIVLAVATRFWGGRRLPGEMTSRRSCRRGPIFGFQRQPGRVQPRIRAAPARPLIALAAALTATHQPPPQLAAIREARAVGGGLLTAPPPPILSSSIKLSAGALAAAPIVYGGVNKNNTSRHCGTGAAELRPPHPDI